MEKNDTHHYVALRSGLRPSVDLTLAFFMLSYRLCIDKKILQKRFTDCLQIILMHYGQNIRSRNYFAQKVTGVWDLLMSRKYFKECC